METIFNSPDEFVVKQGDEAEAMYFIVTGLVEVLEVLTVPLPKDEAERAQNMTRTGVLAENM